MNDGDAGSGKASRHAPDAPSGQHRLRQRANVRLVALQFYARLNPRHARFCWPAAADLLDVQEALCQALSLEDMLDADGGDERYCLAFLKALIGRLEQATGQVTRDAVGKEDVQVDDVELNDALYETFAALMARSSAGSGTSAQPAPCRITHFYPPQAGSLGSSIKPQPESTLASLFPGWKRITVLEENTTIARGTTGLKTWEASLRLAAHLFACPDILEGANILELGCGTGFLGLVAANITQSPLGSTVLTDLDGQVLERARHTIAMNSSSHRTKAVELQPLDWLDVHQREDAACRAVDEAQADVVLAADVVFDPALVGPLASVLQRALQSRGRRPQLPFALIASTVRNEETYSRFIHAVEEHGMHADDIPLHSPQVDLARLCLLDGSGACLHATHMPLLALFPSVHVCHADGAVRLLKVTRA